MIDLRLMTTAKLRLALAGLALAGLSACQATPAPATDTPAPTDTATLPPTATAPPTATNPPPTATRTPLDPSVQTPTPAGGIVRPGPTPTATRPVVVPAVAEDGALLLEDGPHLLIDSFLAEKREGVFQYVNQPQRHLDGPIISGFSEGSRFNNYNYSASVLRDPETGLFRMWYVSVDPATRERFSAYTESLDGVEWGTPIEVPGTRERPIIQVYDEGPDFQPASERFKTILPEDTPPPRWAAELYVSPDGHQWTPYPVNPITRLKYGEIWRLFFDFRNGHYTLLHRWNVDDYSWTDQEGQTHTSMLRDPFVRLFGIATSPDIGSFPDSKVLYAPDERDSGETQFYAISNIVRRGDYWIGLLSISRDDLKASDTPDTIPNPGYPDYEVFGTGYTVMAWSRDGLVWNRTRHAGPYFLPDDDPAAFDHAIAWINSIVPVGDEVYLYYGAYQYGHKVFTDRQIGLLKIKRDRYVGQRASQAAGLLTTPLLRFDAETLTLNVEAPEGQVRVRFLNANGGIISDFGFNDCQTITGDHLDAQVTCRNPLSDLSNRSLRIEFELTNATLYAFSLDEPAAGAAAP